MSEDEWFKRGDKKLVEWQSAIDPEYPDPALSFPEASAFEYAWELAGREMGIVK